MSTLTVQGTGVNDTYMDKGTPTANNGSAVDMEIGCVFNSPNLYRGLVKFDISSIPAGATINSATLTIWTATDFSDKAGTIEVYRVKRAWVDTQATWNVYTTGNNWSTAGCDDTTNDREATNIGSAATPGSTAADTQQDVTLTAAKIQEMISGGTFTNNGFLLRQSNEADWNNGHDYRSTDYATDTTKRPKLVIDYTEATTTSTTISTSTTTTSTSTSTTISTSTTTTSTSSSTSTSLTQSTTSLSTSTTTTSTSTTQSTSTTMSTSTTQSTSTSNSTSTTTTSTTTTMPIEFFVDTVERSLEVFPVGFQ